MPHSISPRCAEIATLSYSKIINLYSMSLHCEATLVFLCRTVFIYISPSHNRNNAFSRTQRFHLEIFSLNKLFYKHNTCYSLSVFMASRHHIHLTQLFSFLKQLFLSYFISHFPFLFINNLFHILQHRNS